MFKERLIKIRDDNKGSTIIEFAIVVPILFLLLLGIIEYNLVMYSQSVLQGAVTTAARAGKTGYVNTGSGGQCPSPVVGGVVVPQSQATYINCIVKDQIGGLMDPSKVQISFRDTGSASFNSATNAPVYTACTNDSTQVNANMPLCQEGTQAAGDIVIYTVTYPWPIVTPIIQNYLGKNGTFNLSASAVVKNEPYGGGH